MLGFGDTAVGIAHSAFAERLVDSSKGLVDYVEVPFEQLIHNPSSGDLRHKIPLLLHCASLSIAGNSPPADSILDEVIRWAKLLRTPWIGEHLAFVRAGNPQTRRQGQELAYVDLPPGEPLNIGYTVSPQYSDEVLTRTITSWSNYERRTGFPIILENGPIYFSMPGSTMSQGSFINRICRACPDVGLLLDVSHLAIYESPLQRRSF